MLEHFLMLFHAHPSVPQWIIHPYGLLLLCVLGAHVREPHIYMCGQSASANAYRLQDLSCQRSVAGSHNTVNDIIKHALVPAGVPSKLELPQTAMMKSGQMV
jgi:hypothetical protein